MNGIISANQNTEKKVGVYITPMPQEAHLLRNTAVRDEDSDKVWGNSVKALYSGSLEYKARTAIS